LISRGAASSKRKSGCYRHSLDLTYSFHRTRRFAAKLRLQNLLDGRTEIEQSIGTTTRLDLSYRM
jgi:hypothetical protein